MLNVRRGPREVQIKNSAVRGGRKRNHGHFADTKVKGKQFSFKHDLVVPIDSEYHGKQLRVCQAQQELLNVPAPENGSLGRGFQDPPRLIQDEQDEFVICAISPHYHVLAGLVIRGWWH